MSTNKHKYNFRRLLRHESSKYIDQTNEELEQAAEIDYRLFGDYWGVENLNKIIRVPKYDLRIKHIPTNTLRMVLDIILATFSTMIQIWTLSLTIKYVVT